jgi:type VI secretion system protein ImpK
MGPIDPFSDIKDDDKTVLLPSPGGRRPHMAAVQAGQTASPSLTPPLRQDVDWDGDNPLLVSASSLLPLVSKLRNLSFHDAVKELQERLIGELRNFEKRALSKGVPRNQMDIAKYLLCSLLDETVLNTPWGGQSGWGHNSLSSIFYKKLLGGVEFFKILDRIKQQPAQNLDLLELAYLCLSLGFEGKYRYMNNGKFDLERQREDLYLLIEKVKGHRQPQLSDQWRGIGEVSNPLIRHVPLWVLAGVAGVLLLLVYMGFAFAIRDKSDRTFGELHAMAQGVTKMPPMGLVQPVQALRPSTSLPHRFKVLLADEISQKKVAVTDDHKLRIFNMFRSGSADVRPEYRSLLSKIAAELQKENTRIQIVGHTDNQRLKFSTHFESNWHLSLARAESAAKVFREYGFPDSGMRFEGMADKEPIAPNNTKANRALNRRIDILFR